EGRLDPARGVLLHGGGDVAVAVEGEGGAVVAQSLLHHLGGHAARQAQRRVQVPQVVEGAPGQARGQRARAQPAPVVVEGGGGQRVAVFAGEDQVVVRPARAPGARGGAPGGST